LPGDLPSSLLRKLQFIQKSLFPKDFLDDLQSYVDGDAAVALLLGTAGVFDNFHHSCMGFRPTRFSG
jgi:hypothetical protein